MTTTSLRRPIAGALPLAAFLFCVSISPTVGADAGDDVKISGPLIQGNLAVYFIHGRSAAGPVPLTLQEALSKKAVVVTETSNVNELEIGNTGNEDVFIQSGTILKGGLQDRVIEDSMLIPAHSEPRPIAVYCVEHGRWSGRGRESAAQFSGADAIIPSHNAKAVLQMERAGHPSAPGRTNVYARQEKIWQDVARIQDKLSTSVGAAVAAPQSSTSLELALENDRLKKAEGDYVAALQAAGKADGDIIGYAFAVNGKLNSAELYPSNGLFRKMWPALLSASAAEALSQKSDNPSDPAPPRDDVQLFLAAPAANVAVENVPSADMRHHLLESPKAMLSETSRASDGRWISRSYLAK